MDSGRKANVQCTKNYKSYQRLLTNSRNELKHLHLLRRFAEDRNKYICEQNGYDSQPHNVEIVEKL